MSGTIKIAAPDLDRIMAEFKDSLAAIGDDRYGAIKKAINGSLQKVRSEAVKIARVAYTARRSKLFEYIKIEPAGLRKHIGTLRIRSKRGVSLIHFKAQPNLPAVRTDGGVTENKRPPGGITAQKRRGGKRQVYGKRGSSKPFIMKKEQGGFGVFVRKGKKDFTMLYGPSPIQALQRKENQDRLNEVAARAFPRLLEEEILKALDRSNR